jgi:hypothetical protein
MSNLEDWFDENIPDEVLHDPSWFPRLLPEPDNITNSNFGYDDIIPDEDDESNE